MPSSASRSERRFRSKSPGRQRKRASRSRSRSRGRSPSRKAKQSPSPARKEVPAEERKARSTPPRQAKATTPPRQRTTPTRQSARIAEIQAEKAAKEANEAKSVDIPDGKAKAEKSPRGKGKTSTPSHKEFGGPIGTFLLFLLTPAAVILLNLACTKQSCDIRKVPAIPRRLEEYLSLKAAGVFLGWIALQAVLALLPIGRLVEGQETPSGQRLTYRCNGFASLAISLGLFGSMVYLQQPVTFVYQNYLQLATTSILFSLLLSVFVYFKASRAPKNALVAANNTGCTIYDYWMGRELNPRIGNLDLKFFCGLRPGLIGWTIINMSFCAEAMKQQGGINPALLLVTIFQGIYVADALWFEEAFLTTLDIVHDGFGFMLSFGDLAFVPFLYSLQGRYLLEHPQTWSYPALAGIALLNVIGYYIFRGSNSQKDWFRKNPHDPFLAHLETIPTPSGKKLLVSGWWGYCRHPNYLGDLLMALSWSLLCGFQTPIPYFYPIYFFILLVHRGMRDDVRCREKHGAAWDRYCQKVKYRLIPFVY